MLNFNILSALITILELDNRHDQKRLRMLHLTKWASDIQSQRGQSEVEST